MRVCQRCGKKETDYGTVIKVMEPYYVKVKSKGRIRFDKKIRKRYLCRECRFIVLGDRIRRLAKME